MRSKAALIRPTRTFLLGALTLMAGTLLGQADAHASTFTVTTNNYNGAEWWGTITFKNNGPTATSSYKVEFDVPAGKHCTNDYVPPGATLSPLTGTGSSAYTVSNHCVYSWSNASPVAPGGSKTFNYSTDSQNFTSASNVQVSDASTCVGGVCTPGGGACTLAGAAQCCSNVCLVTLSGPVCTNP